jgi:hypothetical protein
VCGGKREAPPSDQGHPARAQEKPAQAEVVRNGPPRPPHAVQVNMRLRSDQPHLAKPPVGVYRNPVAALAVGAIDRRL